MWRVYCYTNKANNKKYVGVTNKKLNARAGKNGREYISKNQPFGRAILEYSWDNFYAEILAETKSELEAEMLEKHYIEFYKSTDSDFGYNANKGGCVPTKKEVVQYDSNGEMVGHYFSVKEASDATGVRGIEIINCCLKRTKIVSGHTWRYARDKQTCFNEKELTPFSGERRVCQLNKNGEIIATYNSAKEAEKATGAHRSKICMCCKGQRITAGGYRWEYTDGFCLKDIYHPFPSKPKRVVQYDLEGNFVAEYASQNEAHRQTNISASMIGSCCKGLRKTAVGYIWKYKD